jgi:DNA-binding MarR family transcriptional regulator
LGPAEVLTIRKKYASKLFTLGDLARQYKVTRKTIANIIDRVSWKNLM